MTPEKLVTVLSLGLRDIYVTITKAFGLPKLSLFCKVQGDDASLPIVILE